MTLEVRLTLDELNCAIKTFLSNKFEVYEKGHGEIIFHTDEGAVTGATVKCGEKKQNISYGIKD